MPDSQGTVTAAELRKRLEQKQSRRRHLHKALGHTRTAIKRIRRRLRRKRRAARPKGANKATTWALSKRGVTESPPGSNWGPQIGEWIKYTGYSGPVFWCGCFAAYAVCKIGGAAIPSRIRLGYHGYIIDDARAHRNGLYAVSPSKAKAGDIVAYNFAHIGVIVGPTVNGQIHSVEGNTSSSTGSQNNGGGVFERRRPVSDVAVIARPDYS